MRETQERVPFGKLAVLTAMIIGLLIGLATLRPTEQEQAPAPAPTVRSEPLQPTSKKRVSAVDVPPPATLDNVTDTDLPPPPEATTKGPVVGANNATAPSRTREEIT